MLLYLVLASFLIPFIGAVLTLLIPRGWVKVFSQITAFLAFLCSLIVLIELAALGKVSLTIDLFMTGRAWWYLASPSTSSAH